jgi:hypothetical protein
MGTSKNCSRLPIADSPGVNVNESERERNGIIRRQFCGGRRLRAIFRGAHMIARCAIAIVTLLAAGSARAESLSPDAARRFVTGKLFAFNCFDGSRGAGRIYSDGSVNGTIQFRGAGPARAVWLPAGTLRVRGEVVCASLQGMPFEPCFHLEKTGERSFRGSLSGLAFAYCDFTRRMNVAEMSSRGQ